MTQIPPAPMRTPAGTWIIQKFGYSIDKKIGGTNKKNRFTVSFPAVISLDVAGPIAGNERVGLIQLVRRSGPSYPKFHSISADRFEWRVDRGADTNNPVFGTMNLAARELLVDSVSFEGDDPNASMRLGTSVIRSALLRDTPKTTFADISPADRLTAGFWHRVEFLTIAARLSGDNIVGALSAVAWSFGQTMMPNGLDLTVSSACSVADRWAVEKVWSGVAMKWNNLPKFMAEEDDNLRLNRPQLPRSLDWV